MTTARSCSSCGHFHNEPAAVEAAFAGLSSLSSAYAAVRASDGLCRLHERYITADSLCLGYAPRGATSTRQS